MKITRTLAAALLACSVAFPALAQQQYQDSVDSSSIGSMVMKWINGSGKAQPASAANPMPVSGTFNASAFHIESSLTPITATVGGASSSVFTAGKGVLATNNGTTNTGYCAPGASASTSSQPILPGQSFLIQTTSETQVTCVTSASTTPINLQVGTGLAAGWGGSGSGGGGGAITAASGSYASGAMSAGSYAAGALAAGAFASGVGVDGWDLTQGAKTDAACAGDNTSGCSVEARLQRIAQNVTTLNTTAGQSIPDCGATPCTNKIGVINQAQSVPVTATLQSAAVANGNGTVLNTAGMSAAMLTVNCATCSGGTTINFEATEDGTNYSAINAVQLGTTTIASTTAASGISIWEMPVGGAASLRARISGYSAGTVTVTGHTVPVAYNAKIIAANQAGTWTVQPGNTANTTPWLATINQGSNSAAVKAASTPAATTDPALVVAPIPSELHLGEIASNQIKVQVAQTVTASAYSAGNALGGLMTVANAARVSGSAGAAGTGGILTGLQLNSKAIQTGVQVDIFIFDANPTGSTCTDKSAFVLANADFDKVVGILTIPSTAANGAGWFGATTTGSVGIPSYFPVTYDLASSTSIYACAVVRAAITPGSTSDISFKYNILRN